MGLNTMGWIFLVLAWSSIAVLVVWCFRKILMTGSTYEE